MMKNIQKNTYSFYFLLCFISIISICHHSNAQTSSFLADGTDDFIRRSQLLGHSNLSSSFTVRSFAGNFKAIDSLLRWPKTAVIKTTSPVKISLLPLTLVQQYNSHHPYGWNDEGMISAKGFQTLISAGIEATMGRFSIQIRPQFVYAQNTSFETFPTEHYNIYWASHYQWLNKSDIPEKFGDKSDTHIFPGQSSIRYNAGAVSIGISTENLWWGPGTRNALVMSNNAPGFLHATINTIKPIQTRIGLFEGQIIAGKLSSSGILPPERNRYDENGKLLYIPKKEVDRYITGMVLSWQPKWVKGLFIGFAKASYLYPSDISGVADVLPLQGIIRSTTEKNNQKASLGSLFLRYVMPQEKAELYFEYGRSDKAATLINLVGDHGYPRAYVAGFRKLFATKHNAHIEFLSEFTQMQLPTAELIRSASSWYTHPYVRQGYTNNGQVIGAGIGPGSNSEMIDISWVRGFSKLGLMFERIARNNDFFYNAFVITQDYTRHWIDVSTTAHADWQFKKFLVSSQLALVRSLNYQWYILPGSRYFENGYDFLNFHGRVSVSYRL